MATSDIPVRVCPAPSLTLPATGEIYGPRLNRSLYVANTSGSHDAALSPTYRPPSPAFFSCRGGFQDEQAVRAHFCVMLMHRYWRTFWRSWMRRRSAKKRVAWYLRGNQHVFTLFNMQHAK